MQMFCINFLKGFKTSLSHRALETFKADSLGIFRRLISLGSKSNNQPDLKINK